MLALVEKHVAIARTALEESVREVQADGHVVLRKVSADKEELLARMGRWTKDQESY